MSIEIIQINGQSEFVDYALFESTLKETISKKCSDAKVFLLNNFPVSVSTETNIDLIIVIAINPRMGNYYSPKSTKEKLIYLHNLIIPIKFINHYDNHKLEVEDGNQIICDGDEQIDYSTEINSIRFGLISYLSNRCNFQKEHLFIQPIIIIKNDLEYVIDNYLISKSFDFKSISKYLSKCSSEIFISYKDWKTDSGYSFIPNDIERITDQASKDSEIGYLTKKKVERIGKQLSTSKVIYSELNRNLVIISGKAGTGKSSELLLLTMKCISDSKNTLYLTYNKLLIFDIAKTTKSYINSKINSNSSVRPGESSVLTLHAFFFRLSKSLGVLHVLSAERIDGLIKILKERTRLVYDFISGRIVNGHNIDLEVIKNEIQNQKSFDIGTKEVGIDFINFLKKNGANSILRIKELSADFFHNKRTRATSIQANEVFLADYYGVLENTLLAIQQPEKYFEKYNVQDKFELLEIVLNLKDKHVEKSENGVKIKQVGFNEKKNRSVGGYRRKRTIFIDEAQDCHRLEKEILLTIYGSDNAVIANGGKEQLIRHVELCNWEVSQTKKISIKKHSTRTKSYRVKKTVVDFCNFYAKRYGIDLNLEPLDSEDEGELIFDFREKQSEEQINDIFSHLNLKGEVNGCTLYESLLILLESNSQRDGIPEDNHSERTVINEYGNIEDAPNLNRGTWKHKKTLENKGFMFWDGTVHDKSQLIVPSPNEARVIYYESCRGLEAWSVACFSLDKFFTQKREDPDAERYLIDDLFLSQDNEQRKSMFAATWVLMAMTRVIDTLYIQVNDKNSEVGQIIMDYLNQANKNVREMK